MADSEEQAAIDMGGDPISVVYNLWERGLRQREDFQLPLLLQAGVSAESQVPSIGLARDYLDLVLEQAEARTDAQARTPLEITAGLLYSMVKKYHDGERLGSIERALSLMDRSMKTFYRAQRILHGEIVRSYQDGDKLRAERVELRRRRTELNILLDSAEEMLGVGRYICSVATYEGSHGL